MRPTIPDNDTVIWRYDATTGYWRYVRSVLKENAGAWLRLYSDDHPTGHYKISRRRPRKSP